VADLSQVSTEELMKIAGVDLTPPSIDAEGRTTFGINPPSPVALAETSDLSGYSDEDLMRIAGVTPPARTWGDTALDAGKSLMKGIYGVGEFAQSLTPMGIGNQLAAAVTGMPSYQQQMEASRVANVGDPDLVGANLAERAALRGRGNGSVCAHGWRRCPCC
jgi:hypothetical protein